jgi:hypothetical protein
MAALVTVRALQGTNARRSFMRKTIWTGTFTAIVGFATAAMIAQAPQTPPASQTPQTPPAPQTSAAGQEGKVTVTGCLKTAPPDASSSTAATPPASGASAPTDAKFLLTEATSTPAAASDPSAPPPPAPPTTPSAAQANSTYRLIANPSSLTPHVGKKLALTGTIEKTPAATSTPGTTPASSAESSMLALRVESGKIIADTCTGGQ